MITYMTKEGDVLDWIVWRHYGTVSVIGKVMKENPSVTDEILAPGIMIKLPYIESVQKTSREIKLWS